MKTEEQDAQTITAEPEPPDQEKGPRSRRGRMVLIVVLALAIAAAVVAGSRTIDGTVEFTKRKGKRFINVIA